MVAALHLRTQLPPAEAGVSVSADDPSVNPGWRGSAQPSEPPPHRAVHTTLGQAAPVPSALSRRQAEEGRGALRWLAGQALATVMDFPLTQMALAPAHLGPRGVCFTSRHLTSVTVLETALSCVTILNSR